ncbi:MAG: GAF domain-containing protein, partial [Alphaproteobacteria bacterium]|nr:GAF domain-containing protein [Alphaproteobacteria bacterium]
MLKKQLQNFMRQQGRKAGMQPVQRAANETERVAWLENSGLMDIDLDNDPFISNITQLAAYISSCPKCMVNFLGSDTQRSKGSHGFGMKDRLMTKEVPVDISLCQYVLENPTEQVIFKDKAVDPRLQALAKFPMAPQFEFYVGTPLISSSGYTMGTLCIFDGEKNDIDHRQTEILRLLADQTVLYVEN